MQRYRYSGHGAYPCRYQWLPKAVDAVRESPFYFRDQDEAMVRLGLSKSTVRPLLFWAEAAQVIESWGGRDYGATKFGDLLFTLDPYLESIQSLWLLHWKLTTNPQPLLAWDYLFNHWPFEMRGTEPVEDLIKQVTDRQPVRRTIEDHYKVFLYTYVAPPRARGDIEELMDYPFRELELIRKTGETGMEKEPIYAFNRDSKPSISPETFLYCLNDYWQTRYLHQQSLSFKEIGWTHGSPGMAFRMFEDELAERLDALQQLTHGALQYQESTNLKQVYQHHELDATALLEAVYLADY